MPTPTKAAGEQRKREEAWVGDAVLALFARRWILAQPGIAPGERIAVFTRMTSNQFLCSLGEPTAVEAAIGRIYEAEGLEAAFAHIETAIFPLFQKQEKRRRAGHRG